MKKIIRFRFVRARKKLEPSDERVLPTKKEFIMLRTILILFAFSSSVSAQGYDNRLNISDDRENRSSNDYSNKSKDKSNPNLDRSGEKDEASVVLRNEWN